MNKRQIKKFNKKLHCKTYDKYRYNKIVKLAQFYLHQKYPGEDLGFTIVYITKSKKDKYCYPPKILTNCVPIAVHSGPDNNNTPSIDFEFSCDKLPDTPGLKEKASTLINVYKAWMEGVKNA